MTLFRVRACTRTRVQWKILFHTPVKNCGNSPQSAVDDHQNHSQNIINSVRGERRPSDLLGPCLWWLTQQFHNKFTNSNAVQHSISNGSPWREILPHQTQIKICPYISLGINSNSQIAPVKLGKENSPVSCWPHEKRLPLDSARKAASLRPKDLGPASSNLPCSSKRQAKLLADSSVQGCWGPSWDSRPSKARRCSPSASRLEMER